MIALAVTTSTRLKALPDVPTVAEGCGLPGFESSTWYGLFGPAHLPPAIAAKMSDAVIRLSTPEPIAAVTVMVVAAIGVAVNGVTAWLFMAGGSQDLNIRGAFLHMASDALVSLAVVAGGALYLWKGWGWIDPALSLAIAVVILIGTWSLFRKSLHLMLDGVPDHIRLAEVEGALLAQAGVRAVHDLHVWAMGTSSFALTAHLVLADEGVDREVILERSNDVIRERFNIEHITLQVESGDYAGHCGGCDNAGKVF